eukprot:m.587139 g.587139  ORF g.587139 m.587139 type:complete len:86 (+) comp57981_c0_seq5:1176-1433(+)
MLRFMHGDLWVECCNLWKDGMAPLHMACIEGRLAVANILIDAGANVSQAADSGETPLYLASQEGYLSVVQLLAARGASLTQATNV